MKVHLEVVGVLRRNVDDRLLFWRAVMRDWLVGQIQIRLMIQLGSDRLGADWLRLYSSVMPHFPLPKKKSTALQASLHPPVCGTSGAHGPQLVDK